MQSALLDQAAMTSGAAPPRTGFPQSEGGAPRPESRSRLILLVDDNPDDVQLTVRALQRTDPGLQVIVATSGLEALDYLFATGRHADGPPLPAEMVLLDLQMPEIDGLEVLSRIRNGAARSTVPVVVLSSSRDSRDIARSYSLGCNSYIAKPVDYDAFLCVARLVSAYWLLVNEPPARS